jgi:hypothetical protein
VLQEGLVLNPRFQRQNMERVGIGAAIAADNWGARWLMMIVVSWGLIASVFMSYLLFC